MIQLHRQSIFLVPIALLYFTSQANAVGPQTVLAFDDINTGSNVVAMPSGYGGVSWPNNVGVYGFTQEGNFLPQSPPNRVVFNRSPGGGQLSGVAETVVTFINSPKIFNGAYVSGFLDVHFNLYSGGTLVGTSSVLNLGPIDNATSGPTFLASGYAGPVDAVGIFGDRLRFCIDDFTFEEVPEPSTLLLLAIGAISLLGRRKARSHG
jgi:hypothetical protein